MITALALSLLLAPSNRAVALTYGGAVDTDLTFSEFWDGDFTLTVRFMEQFPFAYAGPLLSNEGKGDFIVGQGDYFWEAGHHPSKGNWPWKSPEGRKAKVPMLSLWRGADQVVGKAPTIHANEWHQLALVKQNGQLQMMLDGKAIGDGVAAGTAPDGTLRIGRPGTGHTMQDGRDGQFYGLVDDVALYKKALTASDLANGAGGRLSARESGLAAGYTFDTPNANGRPFPIPLNRRATLLHKTWSRFVPVAESRKDADADAGGMLTFAVPGKHILPIPENEEWYVIQGYADGTGSHNGYAAFCVDLDLAKGQPQTLGTPFTSASNGFLTAVRESGVTDTPDIPVNAIVVRQAPGFWAGYLHMKEKSFSQKFQAGKWAKENTKAGKLVIPAAEDIQGATAWVTAGETLGLVSSVGAGKGAYHLHFAISDHPDLSMFPNLKGKTFATIPAGFRDYEVKQPNGTWKKVALGYLQAGAVVRRVE